MKVALVLGLVFLFAASSVNSQCVITAPVASFGTSCSSSSGCTLNAALILSVITDAVNCGASVLSGGVNLVLAPTGSGTLNLQLSASTGLVYTSLNITANPGVTIKAVTSSALEVAQSLYLYGNAALTVAAGTVVTVQNSVTVQAQATLNVAGNLTVATAMTVYGTVYLAGTRAEGAAQNAWVVLKNAASSISISGSASASAYIRGNGGFDASLALSGNATIAAGNSPGTVFVNGDLDMDPTTTLEIDVASATDFDLLVIKKEFKRDGILYAHFESGYVPNNKQLFTFATHTSASGDFSVSHGNYMDATFDGVKPRYNTATTAFQYSSAASLAASLFVIFVCTLLVL